MDPFSEAILAKHPDAGEILNSDDFVGWVARQAPTVGLTLYGDARGRSGTAAEIVRVISDYKAAVGYGKPFIREPSFTREQISNMSVAEFQAKEKEIDRALARGRIR